MRSVALAAALVACTLTGVCVGDSLVSEAAAQDKRKQDDEDKKKKEQARKNKIEKQLRELGAAFGAKDYLGLVAKMADGGKLSLGLDGKSGSYSAAQATEVLKLWFEGVQTLSVQTKSEDAKIDRNLASFPLTLIRKGETKSQSRHLTIKIDDAATGLPLLQLTVDS